MQFGIIRQNRFLWNHDFRVISSYMGGIITYCRCKVHSHLNSKMEILAIFSILNSLFLPKMEILTVFSILNSLFILKLEILTVFFILNNKKIWETMSRLNKIDFWATLSSQISGYIINSGHGKIPAPDLLFFCIYNYLENQTLFSIYFLV